MDEPVMEASTMPLNRPEMPQKGQMSAPVTKDASMVIRDYIKPELLRYPLYDYKTGKQWFLSKTEQVVVDAYIETNSQKEACRALNAIRGAHGSTKFYHVDTITRWLKKPHVASYIGEKFNDRGKVNWFDIAKWEAWAVDNLQSKVNATQVQVAIWKEYGKAKGWYKDTGPQVLNNTQINFVQSDGKA